MKNIVSLSFILFVVLLARITFAADSPWLYGIHWYGDPDEDDVEAMTGGKGLWCLETVNLYEDTWWQLGGQEEQFLRQTAKGHSVIIRIQPKWGWAIPRAGEREKYLADLAVAARQAGDYCHIWQIGNETNLYGEYGGGVLNAEEYIEFYKQARQAIKSAESPLGEQIVLVAAVSPGEYYNEVRHTDGLVYLRQMCVALEPGDTDGFALHSYGAPWQDAGEAAGEFMRNIEEQLKIIDEKGFYDKPAFVLEWNRQTNPPGNADQEAQTAQFLMKSYERLNAWNADPTHHQVVCAAWFIYKYDDDAWSNMSIRHLKDLGPRGENNDVWDAFQAACARDYEAGSMTPRPCGEKARGQTHPNHPTLDAKPVE